MLLYASLSYWLCLKNSKNSNKNSQNILTGGLYGYIIFAQQLNSSTAQQLNSSTAQQLNLTSSSKSLTLPKFSWRSFVCALLSSLFLFATLACGGSSDGSSDDTKTPQIKITVSTLAGDGTAGFADGAGTAAQFDTPIGIAVDSADNIYIADFNNNRIRKISPAGVVSTFAGSGATGSTDGTGTAASFNFPADVGVDSSGNVYVADLANHRIRKISPVGVVSTFAGDGANAFKDDIGTAAQFSRPAGVGVDSAGNLYIADLVNHRIRKISPAGMVSTLAGDGTAGSTDGAGTVARFSSPTGVALDSAGNVYVADQSNHSIRKITSGGTVSTLAGDGTAGFADGAGMAAQFNTPTGIAVDSAGNIYVVDKNNNRIRKISPAGVVSTFAGDGTAGFADGTGTAAQFNDPGSVALDSAGNIYVGDTDNNRIRKITISNE